MFWLLGNRLSTNDQCTVNIPHRHIAGDIRCKTDMPPVFDNILYVLEGDARGSGHHALAGHPDDAPDERRLLVKERPVYGDNRVGSR
jgi:hypothetical protein